MKNGFWSDDYFWGWLFKATTAAMVFCLFLLMFVLVASLAPKANAQTSLEIPELPRVSPLPPIVQMVQAPPATDASTNIVSERGAAWFALVALVAALGVPFTRKAVDFTLERKWAKWIKDDWRILLAFVFAVAWTLFMFQDGILNIAALALLPVWQSVLIVSVLITLAAAGTVDGDARAQKKAVKIALMDDPNSSFGDGDLTLPRAGKTEDYA
jgi:hypothetical protein